MQFRFFKERGKFKLYNCKVKFLSKEAGYFWDTLYLVVPLVHKELCLFASSSSLIQIIELSWWFFIFSDSAQGLINLKSLVKQDWFWCLWWRITSRALWMIAIRSKAKLASSLTSDQRGWCLWGYWGSSEALHQKDWCWPQQEFSESIVATYGDFTIHCHCRESIR